MVRLEIIALLLISLIGQQQRIECDEFQNRHSSVYRKVADLRDEFNKDVKHNFYDKTARRDNSHDVVAIAAKMAESKAILHAYQLRGLMIAGEIIRIYFIQASRPLNEILMRSKHLVDLIVDRILIRSIEQGLQAIEHYRKELYLLLMHYGHDSGLKHMAKEYSRSIAIIERRETALRQGLQASLHKYRELVPLTLFVNDTEPDVIQTIDEMINDAEQLTDRFEGASGMDKTNSLLRKYIDPKVFLDIRMAIERTANRIQFFASIRVQSVNMTEVKLFEDQALLENDQIANCLDEINRMYDDLDAKFRDYIGEIFEQPQQVNDTAKNYPLRGVSALMAEYGALLYSDDRRMLTVMKDLIEEMPVEFNQTVALDNRPMDILVKRLVKYADENAPFTNERARRKYKIYILLRHYDHIGGVRALGRLFANHNINREQRASRAGVCLMQSMEQLRETPGRASQMLDFIENYFSVVVSKWQDHPDEQRLLRLTLDRNLLARIRQERVKASNRLLRVRRSDLLHIDISKVRRYELRLAAEITTSRAQV